MRFDFCRTKTLREATDLFEQSEFTKRVLGVEVVEHYTHAYRVEQAAFDTAVTDWEAERLDGTASRTAGFLPDDGEVWPADRTTKPVSTVCS